MVKASLNYLAPMEEKPVYYQYPPPPGTSWRNTHGDRRTLPIHDARSLDPKPSLDAQGFELAPLRTALEDLYDAEARGASLASPAGWSFLILSPSSTRSSTKRRIAHIGERIIPNQLS